MVIFFWIIDLIIPITMIIIGLIFIYNPPKKINPIYGYRTLRSMKSKAAWDFAHHECGQIWIKAGIVLLISTAITKPFISLSEETLCLIYTALGVLAIFISIPIVERKLKKHFDEFGNPKI